MYDLKPEIILPFILYAETHYKFKGIYSRLIKNEPEIIADAPFRVEPNQEIPILILIKDAHRFPIQLISFTIEIKGADRTLLKKNIPLNITIDKERFWHQIFYVNPPDNFYGPSEINVVITIKIDNKIKKYHNDNYRISSHDPLKVYLAAEPLPRFKNYYFGDFHYHSNFTEDQVEFGAPVKATVQIARALGLNFFAVTDHSYDLDDSIDSWTDNDHSLAKWYRFWKEVEQLNSSYSDFVILPGEEVSAGNHRNRNVHLLILNNRQFFPGQGDSAERWFCTKPDFSIDQILNQLEDNTLAIAGHPEMPIPFLQWLLIRRGRWQWQDLIKAGLDGFQIWNGEYDHSFYQDSQTWIQLLLEGKRLTLVAGNDAHGNFNRFRQIGFPFFTFRESYTQLFGNMRTGVKLNKKLNLNTLIHAVKDRHVLISNGPIVDFFVQNERGHVSAIGDKISGNQFNIFIRAKSTAEFGRITSFQLLIGDFETKKERPFLTIEQFPGFYRFEKKQTLSNLNQNCYVRAELIATKDDGKITRCLTNPIWITKQ